MRAADIFEKYRKIINPPYSGKDFAVIFATLFILISIPLTVILAQRGLNLRSFAAENRTVSPSLSLTATYKSISVYASFASDDNQNNSASFQYRKVGDATWKNGMEMTPDRRSTVAGVSNPYKNQWRASILVLDPNTSYEVKVSFTDSDGVSGTNPLTATVATKNENIPLGSGTTYFVSPSGSDSNPGTESQPFKTIQKAASTVTAGATVKIKAGTYNEMVTISSSGTASNYITFLPYGDGDVIIDGQGTKDANFDIGGNYIRVSGLKARNAKYPAINIEGDNIVIENMEVKDWNKADLQDQDHWVSGISINDTGSTNLTIRGNTISRSNGQAGFTAPSGISIRNENLNAGGGHAIYNNKIYGNGGKIKDGIGGLPNFEAAGFVYKDSDIYDNTIEAVYDDGIEAEGGDVNVRVWGNLIKNSATISIASAPAIIGPLYVFRNVGIAAADTHVKLGENSTGNAYYYHNTFYGGPAHGISDSGGEGGIANLKFRNNIVHNGLSGWGYVINCYQSSASVCRQNSWDYDALYSATDDEPFKWGGNNYATLASFQAVSGQEMHGIYTNIANELNNPSAGDYTLKSSSQLIDKGEVLVGFNDATSAWPYSGNAPDMGAYEYGSGPPTDTSPPTVSITSPASGSTVSGTLTISANASDNVGVTKVEFYLDTSTKIGEGTTSPYSISWNCTTVSNGSHTLLAKAYDAAGNVGTSSSVSITVNNADSQPPSVSITSPASGSTISGTATITASASDNIGVTRVEFYYDSTHLIGTDITSPYSISWNTTAVSNGSHSLLAKAYDAAGNVGTSSLVSVTVNNQSGRTGDLNGDGVVNIIDASILAGKWGTNDPAADLNHDGTVNIIDASILAGNWGS